MGARILPEPDGGAHGEGRQVRRANAWTADFPPP